MAEPNGDGVFVVVDRAVATITISNPRRRNALTRAMIEQLRVEFARIEDAVDLRAVILRGDGEAAFASGLDLGELGDAAAGQGWTELEAAASDMFAAVRDCQLPVIAAIQGACVGGGLALALAADIRVAATSAVFAIPAARIGVAYPLAETASVVDAIGASRAAHLLFTGDRLAAHDAAGIGLVTEVVPTPDVDTRALALAHRISANAPLSVRAAKASIRAATGGSADAARTLIEKCADSADFREGGAAAREKRPPVFRGI